MTNSLKTLYQQLSENFNIPQHKDQNENYDYIVEGVEEECYDDDNPLEEDNSGLSGGEYMTPNAFRVKSQGQTEKDIDDPSYSEDVPSTDRFFKKIDDIYNRTNLKVQRLNESIRLDELSYQNYREDDTKTERQKINSNILEINKKLREVEQMISHASKLKLETGAGSDVYWKGTAKSFLKIKERLTRLTGKIVEISG